MTPTEEMVRVALDAWFASPPSETDQGLERSMKAALTAALAAMWQPIETAPKDGTIIDLWCAPPKGSLAANPGGGRITDCWHSSGKWWRYDDSKYATDMNNCRTEVWYPTHYMPLPPAPTLLSTRMGSEKTSESGHSPSTHNSESE